jgi:hypothetical protein
LRNDDFTQKRKHELGNSEMIWMDGMNMMIDVMNDLCIGLESLLMMV